MHQSNIQKDNYLLCSFRWRFRLLHYHLHTMFQKTDYRKFPHHLRILSQMYHHFHLPKKLIFYHAKIYTNINSENTHTLVFCRIKNKGGFIYFHSSATFKSFPSVESINSLSIYTPPVRLTYSSSFFFIKKVLYTISSFVLIFIQRFPSLSRSD